MSDSYDNEVNENAESLDDSIDSEVSEKTESYGAWAQYFKDDDHSLYPKAAEEGKVYIWDAFDGRMDLGSKISKLPDHALTAWMLVHGNTDLLKRRNAIYRDLMDDEYDEEKIDTLDKGVEGVAKSAGGKLYLASDFVADPLPKGQEEQAWKLLSDVNSAMSGASSVFYRMRSDESDPEKRQFAEHCFERFAEWMDEYGYIVGTFKDSYLLGIARNPILNEMMARYAEMPKIECTLQEKDLDPNPELAKKQIEANVTENTNRTINVLGQLDQPKESRVSIFDDYMDIMDGIHDEIKVELRRQLYEKNGGWDVGAESLHRKWLRTAHNKIISAYDRLLSVDDHGQYDKVIGDKLNNITGKTGPDRDMAGTVGFMRGQVRAIDLGYPSDQFFVLGYLGEIEAKIDLRLRGCEHDIKKSPENAEKYTKEKQALEGLRGEFNAMKNEVWDKEYPGPDAALESWHKTKAFLDEHPNLTDHIESYVFFVKQSATGLAERSAEIKSLTSAMEQFNVKRTDLWFSTESPEHMDLRLETEKLKKDLMAYKSGIYQEGEKKGLAMTEKEREALKDGLEKSATEVAKKADVYLDARKKARSTEAGRTRKAGAEQIRDFASKLKFSIEIEKKREREHDRKVNADRYESEDIMQALDNDRKYTIDDKSGKTGHDMFEKERAKHYTEFCAKSQWEVCEDYMDILSKVVAGKSVAMMREKDPSLNARTALDKLDRAASSLKQDATFKQWADQFTHIGKEYAENRKNLAKLSPGEIYVKFGTFRQREHIKEKMAEQQPVRQAKMQRKAPEPKAPGME